MTRGEQSPGGRPFLHVSIIRKVAVERGDLFCLWKAKTRVGISSTALQDPMYWKGTRISRLYREGS